MKQTPEAWEVKEEQRTEPWVVQQPTMSVVGLLTLALWQQLLGSAEQLDSSVFRERRIFLKGQEDRGAGQQCVETKVFYRVLVFWGRKRAFGVLSYSRNLILSGFQIDMCETDVIASWIVFLLVFRWFECFAEQKQF